MSLAKIHENHAAAEAKAREAFEKYGLEGYDFEQVSTYVNADAEYRFQVQPMQDYVRLSAGEMLRLGRALQAANQAYQLARDTAETNNKDA